MQGNMPHKNTNEKELAIILSTDEFFTLTPLSKETKVTSSFPKKLKDMIVEIRPWKTFTSEDGHKYSLVSPKKYIS